MKIGGFVKQSLIDYPGKIAAVIFTQGCNFRCGYCHNPQLVLPELYNDKPAYAAANILQYLKEHKDWLDGVVVTGGEPTIHMDLPEFLKEIKDYGYLVKLDTNGSGPIMLERILKNNLADSIAMDIKTFPDKISYAEITGIHNMPDIADNIITSVILLKNSGIDIEFRTTLLPIVNSSELIDRIKKYIGPGARHVVNEYRKGKTIDFYKKDL